MGHDLGLHVDKVELRNFSDQWAASFQEHAELLNRILPTDIVDIQHVGSTSVGLPAKPIIDIAVAVQSIDEVEQFDFATLREHNYYRLRVKLPGEVIIARFTNEDFTHKTHILHVVEADSTRWLEMVGFRDELLQNADLRARYLQLKRELSDQFPTDIGSYSEGKGQFVKDSIRHLMN